MNKTSINHTSSIINHAFTMIELLVVISIIGILAGLATISFTNSQKQARDSARKSDLRQYATAVEAFANKNNGLFPGYNNASGVQASAGLCTTLAMTACPEDAKYSNDNTFSYRYQSDGSVATGAAVATRYVLWGKLEGTTDYWVACSNGKVGKRAQSGFGVSTGTCPI